MRSIKNFENEKKNIFVRVKHNGDEFIGKAILIILALVIGGIFIATMKTQFTSFTTKIGSKMDNFFNQEDSGAGAAGGMIGVNFVGIK